MIRNYYNFLRKPKDALSDYKAYYKFDGNILDESGNFNGSNPIDLTYINDRNGNANKALRLNGTTSQFDILNNFAVSDVKTLNFWAKMGYGASSQTLIAIGQNSVSYTWGWVVLSTTKLIAGYFTGVGFQYNAFEYTGTLDAANWHNYNIQFPDFTHIDISNAGLWIDDSLKTISQYTGVSSPTPPVVTGGSRVGDDYNISSDWHIQCDLDELRIYGRELTASERATLAA